MTKRKNQILSLLLCAVLVLGLLSACASQGDTPSESEPTPSQSEPSPTVPEEPEPSADPVENLSAQQILNSTWFTLLEMGGDPIVMFEEYDPKAFFTDILGVDKKDFKSAGVLTGAGYGTRLYAMCCPDEDAADRAEACLRDCIGAGQIVSPDGFPDPVPAAVYRQGLYVAMFMYPDQELVSKAFFSVLATGERADHLAAVTEPPAFELQDLLLRLLVEGGACPDWPALKSKGWSDVRDGEIYGLSHAVTDYGAMPSQYEACVYAVWDPKGDELQGADSPYNLVLFQTGGEEQAKALQPALEQTLESRRESLRAMLADSDYDPNADLSGCTDEERQIMEYLAQSALLLENLETARITQAGRYAAILVCDDPAQAAASLPRFITASDTKGFYERYYNNEAQTVEYERDPNYPDRELFTPPNEEDMSIYDTTAILSAWKKGDPAGLSDYDREIYNAAKVVLDEIITGGMTDLEKETAVYTWIAQTVDYSWSRMDILAETSRDAYGPYGGLVNHEAVCLGYATTFQLLMDMLDIECLTVVGAAVHSTGDHAWNVVKINGNWFCTDVTWGRDQIGGEYEWRYFNITSDEMAQDHQWDYANVPEAVTEGNGRQGI